MYYNILVCKKLGTYMFSNNPLQVVGSVYGMEKASVAPLQNNLKQFSSCFIYKFYFKLKQPQYRPTG